MANINGIGGYFFRYLFSNPIPYARTGLDPKRARATARNSPHRHEMQIAGFAPLAAFLTEVGLLGPIARRGWKRCQVSVTQTPIAAADDVIVVGGGQRCQAWRRAAGSRNHRHSHSPSPK